jgi:hypothetical protein
VNALIMGAAAVALLFDSASITRLGLGSLVNALGFGPSCCQSVFNAHMLYRVAPAKKRQKNDIALTRVLVVFYIVVFVLVDLCVVLGAMRDSFWTRPRLRVSHIEDAWVRHRRH